MDKYKILALMMRDENRIEGDPFSLTAKLAALLETTSRSMTEEELADFIRIGGALYRIGIEQYGQSVRLEDLFPASENWRHGPHPHRSGYRNRR